MNPTATFFFLAAAIFALIGMAWGIQMSATHDHGLSPAHGHLNLLGFVTMAVFGTYYALNSAAAQSNLAKVHFGLAIVSVVVIVPGIVMAISEQGEALAKIGSVLTILSMALFAFTVFRHRKSA